MRVFVQDDSVVEFVGIQRAVPQNKRRIRASVEECAADLAASTLPRTRVLAGLQKIVSSGGRRPAAMPPSSVFP